MKCLNQLPTPTSPLATLGVKAFAIVKPQLEINTTPPNTAHATAGNFWREYQSPLVRQTYAVAGN